MVNQKLYIINLSNFYDIFSELKEHINFDLLKFDNKDIFFDKYKKKKVSIENSILIVSEKEYDFFVKNINEDQVIKFKPPINILSFMESEDWSRRLPEMKEFLSLCDQQRGVSFAETFPEMKDIFNEL